MSRARRSRRGFSKQLLLGVLLLASSASAQGPPVVRKVDRIRVAEAFRLADALGNRLWPGWDKAPFAVLLVTRETEFLIRHPEPSADFTLIGEDTLLRHKVWFRPRQHPTHFLATFPAVGGVPTIVVGQAESTAARTSTRWVVTLLHEHFHQLQNSQPGYYSGVDSLGLARGDQTGMWMLNYDFPYANAAVQHQFSTACKALVQALRAGQRSDFTRKLAAYVEARQKLRSLLESDDYRYLAFQAWQEGIARYTEYRVAELAASDYKPSAEFLGLEDYTSFQEVARATRQGIEQQLESAQLGKAKRTAFYSLGAAEGLVLDRAYPDWRKRYFVERFSLDSHFLRGK